MEKNTMVRYRLPSYLLAVSPGKKSSKMQEGRRLEAWLLSYISLQSICPDDNRKLSWQRLSLASSGLRRFHKRYPWDVHGRSLRGRYVWRASGISLKVRFLRRALCRTSLACRQRNSAKRDPDGIFRTCSGRDQNVPEGYV